MNIQEIMEDTSVIFKMDVSKDAYTIQSYGFI